MPLRCWLAVALTRHLRCLFEGGLLLLLSKMPDRCGCTVQETSAARTWVRAVKLQLALNAEADMLWHAKWHDSNSNWHMQRQVLRKTTPIGGGAVGYFMLHDAICYLICMRHDLMRHQCHRPCASYQRRIQKHQLTGVPCLYNYIIINMHCIHNLLLYICIANALHCKYHAYICITYIHTYIQE
jgi:hypothetical protein